jgi:hypothetical protein
MHARVYSAHHNNWDSLFSADDGDISGAQANGKKFDKDLVQLIFL